MSMPAEFPLSSPENERLDLLSFKGGDNRIDLVILAKGW